MTRNKLAFAKEMKQRFEDALNSVTDELQMVMEDGSIHKWHWDVDIDKVKKDLQKDIKDAEESIKALIERKELLEQELTKLNYEKLIVKF